MYYLCSKISDFLSDFCGKKSKSRTMYLFPQNTYKLIIEGDENLKKIVSQHQCESLKIDKKNIYLVFSASNTN